MQVIKKERNSSLELLRIISMLLIVAAHFSVQGGFPKPTVADLDFSYVCQQIIGLYAYVGVSAFMLITGYFMVSSTKTNGRKAFKLIVDILFYSILLLAICGVLGLKTLSKTDIFGSLIPWGNYWFVVNYIVILLLSPYLNTLLLQLSKKQYLSMLMIVVFSLRLFSYFLLGHLSITGGTFDYFIIFYLIGGYIKLHVKQKRNNKWNLIVAILSFIVVAFIALAVDGYAVLKGNDAILQYYIHFKNLDSLPADICAIALFLYFSRKEFRNKFINKIASYTLDVYLIHTNRLIMFVIWCVILPNTMFLHTPYFLGFSVVKILVVYVICTLIGWLKSITWDELFNRWMDKHYTNIETNIDSFICRIVK